jgi:hypothetical protein
MLQACVARIPMTVSLSATALGQLAPVSEIGLAIHPKTNPANNSLERTQHQRGFKYDVAVLRRSARGR